MLILGSKLWWVHVGSHQKSLSCLIFFFSLSFPFSVFIQILFFFLSSAQDSVWIPTPLEVLLQHSMWSLSSKLSKGVEQTISHSSPNPMFARVWLVANEAGKTRLLTKQPGRFCVLHSCLGVSEFIFAQSSFRFDNKENYLTLFNFVILKSIWLGTGVLCKNG